MNLTTGLLELMNEGSFRHGPTSGFAQIDPTDQWSDIYPI